MTEISKRFQRVTAAFTERARAVPADSWEHPAPCEGWVARDVVKHLVDWIPGLLCGGPGIPIPTFPSVDEDPVGAWEAFVAVIMASLHDPDIATLEFDTPPGLDETLLADEVHQLYVGMQPYDELLRTSGHYGPKVAVSDDADEQTKLLAFSGRRP